MGFLAVEEAWNGPMRLPVANPPTVAILGVRPMARFPSIGTGTIQGPVAEEDPESIEDQSRSPGPTPTDPLRDGSPLTLLRRSYVMDTVLGSSGPRTSDKPVSRMKGCRCQNRGSYCTWPLGTLTRCVSEGVKPLPRLHFGLVWNVSFLTACGISRRQRFLRTVRPQSGLLEGLSSPKNPRNRKILSSRFDDDADRRGRKADSFLRRVISCMYIKRFGLMSRGW